MPIRHSISTAILLLSIPGLTRAGIRYQTEPVDWEQKKLDIRINVLNLERRDESDESGSMECLDKRAVKLTLPVATGFLIDELKASRAYREVVLASDEEWVRSGEVLVQGTINRLGKTGGWNYVGVMHWKVTIPSSKRILWEGNTQQDAEKAGILNYHVSRVCSEILRQNFFQLREQLSAILPQELQYKDPNKAPTVRIPEIDD